MRRKTPEDYHNLAEKRGFRWIGPEVPTTATKTGWECEQGHHWEARYNSIDQGSGCPVCANRVPKTPEDYYELARERGFCWLGPEASTTHTKTTWRCEQGHQWEATYDAIHHGNGCPVCAVERKAEQRRHKPADYRGLARERGFRWIGPEVPNNRTKTTWECEYGHQWEATYGSMRNGTDCPVCTNRVPKTLADYQYLAQERGFLWIGPEVPTTLTKTWWECELGHRWQAPYGRIQQGHGCPHCYGKTPKTPADYRTLAEKRGFCWLGPEVPNTSTKTDWECEKGHRWEATFNNVRQGTGCPVCYGNLPKTPDDYRMLAEGRGFRWLGPEVPNVTTKTVWECADGHQWEARFSDIQQAHGCPVCANRIPKTPDDYHALAQERGFRWLGPEVPTTSTKTGWECEQGHHWEAAYGNVRAGTGCPFCAGTAPKTPDDYHALAEERDFRWIGPEVRNTEARTIWECEQGHRWEATFNNVRHGTGCPVCYGNLPKTPADYCALADQRGFQWLGPEVPNVLAKTVWECESGHQWEAPYNGIQQGYGCPFCAGIAPKTPDDYHALAAERGFRWLGPEVPDIKSKTGWVCQLEHQWEARYNDIQQGTGCPACAIETKAEQLRKTPSDYHALAAERGLRWLGPEVPNSSTKTVWECEQGHRWESVYGNVRAGYGCPFCAGKAPKTPDDYHALAEEQGFGWIGPEVSNVRTKTGWECEEGHQWQADYSHVQRGGGCPICIDMVEGARVSQVQRVLCDMLDGDLNRPFESDRIDVALEVNGTAIAVEYDSWYWHAGREEEDTKRDKTMIAAGWRVLHVRSNEQLPTQGQLDAAIALLLEGVDQVEIVLDDWGKGPTRLEIADVT